MFSRVGAEKLSHLKMHENGLSPLACVTQLLLTRVHFLGPAEASDLHLAGHPAGSQPWPWTCAEDRPGQLQGQAAHCSRTCVAHWNVPWPGWAQAPSAMRAHAVAMPHYWGWPSEQRKGAGEASQRLSMAAQCPVIPEFSICVDSRLSKAFPLSPFRFVGTRCGWVRQLFPWPSLPCPGGSCWWPR